VLLVFFVLNSYNSDRSKDAIIDFEKRKRYILSYQEYSYVFDYEIINKHEQLENTVSQIMQIIENKLVWK